MRKFLLPLAAAIGLLMLTGSFESPPSALAVPPSNDNLANAVTVTTPTPSGIVATVTNVDATTETNEKTSFMAADCPADGFFYLTDATVWYNWTAPSTGTFVFDTFGSDFDTTLAIYTGSAYPLTLVACREGSPGTAGPSALSFAATSGVTYRIQVGGFGGSSGNSVLNIASGAAIYVNDGADVNARDNSMTLREAMLLANGGLAFASLTAAEQNLVLNGAAAGASGADLIHFATSPNIALSGLLPTLTGSPGDHVSGIGATVTVDGQTSFICFALLRNSAISGLTIRRCTIGVSVGADGNRIGGTSSTLERNVIRENGQGIRITGNGATNNVVRGNYIGLAADGVTAMGNSHGIVITGLASANIVGGSTNGEGNVISGNSTIGVWVDNSSGNFIRGNLIGLDAGGTLDRGNGFGIDISTNSANNQIGGALSTERNVISGNNLDAVVLEFGATNNSVKGNYIGTNAAGTAAVANTGSGVGITGGSGNNNTVGGSAAGEGNVVAGNGSNGVLITAGSEHSVTGNYIGTNASGTAAIPNFTGVNIHTGGVTVGGAGAGQGNVISGNTNQGVLLTSGTAQGNSVLGNRIGTNASGTSGVPNFWGVVAQAGAQSNTIGNTSGGGNLIAFNAGPGVEINGSAPGTTGNSIRGNSIHDNKALEIDNVSGGNNELAPPVLTSSDGSTVHGLTCPNCFVDIFSTGTTPTNPFSYEGSVQANMSGSFSFNKGVPLAGPNVVGTTTDGAGNTSEVWCDDDDGDSFGQLIEVSPGIFCTIFSDSREPTLGTNPANACADTPAENDETVDPWPLDTDDDGFVDTADITSLTNRFGHAQTPSNIRYDLNLSGSIDTGDIVLMTNRFGRACVPPGPMG